MGAVSTAVFVADAGKSIGAGHVMRCLTLASEFVSQGVSCTLLSRDLPESLVARCEMLNIKKIERSTDLSDAGLAREIEELAPTLVVLDGYMFTATSVNEIYRLGLPTLVIDDNRETSLNGATFLLNQNPHATVDMYSDLVGLQRTFLGLEYALIRFEVASRRRDAARAERDGSAVVAMGGSDPLDIGASLVGELQIGGIAARMADGLFGAESISSPEQVSEWFARSGVAVVGAGSSLWELACLGTPTVAVVVADNQLSLAQSAEKAGLVKAIDARRGIRPQEIASIVAQLLSDRAKCDEMGKRGQALVDGLGAARVVSGILHTLNHET